MKIVALFLVYIVANCYSYKILAIFPYNGRSHHIYYSALIEELAKKQHSVTVINYHPILSLTTLRQISLQDNGNSSDQVNIEEHLKTLSYSDFSVAYDSAQAFKYIANTNCRKLVENQKVQDLVQSATHYDLVIVEQFVTDCGLALAHKLNVPTVGMTAHILMPWTYSRLGMSNNPSFVPNHFFASGTKPDLYNRVKSLIINFGMNFYYTHVIQKSDQEIVNDIFPDTPLLEDLGKKLSLVLINQYFPLTGSRIYGANVIEVGGMHINGNAQIEDKALQKFLDSAINEVVYISFGSVASNLPLSISNEIIKLIEQSNLRFVWKTDISHRKLPSNVFVGKWMPQAAILCHPNVVGFISHSGMLSTSEAVHCGVPIVGVPLFGDQFANSQSAVESGLGVTLDVRTLNAHVLEDAVKTILLEKYQNRAKELSKVWKDRPLSPMKTAIFWIEYVARNKGIIDLRPATVALPLYQFLMIDVVLVLGSILIIVMIIIFKFLSFLVSLVRPKNITKKEKRKKKD